MTPSDIVKRQALGDFLVPLFAPAVVDVEHLTPPRRQWDRTCIELTISKQDGSLTARESLHLILDSERPLARVGGIDTVPPEIFDGAHYVALGHLHLEMHLSRAETRFIDDIEVLRPQGTA